MLKKVLILSVSSGYGHIAAAQAIEQAFVDMGASREVKHIDTLQYSTKLLKTIASNIYILLLNKSPQAIDWLTSFFEKPWKSAALMTAFYKYNCLPLIKFINNCKPDLIVCTHFIPALIISSLKEKKLLAAPQAIVMTDFDMQANWLCRQFEQYFVAFDETMVQMVKVGIPAEKITVSGIPIHPKFAQHKDQALMRAKFGLKQDRTTLLISTGGYGVGPLEALVTSLMEIKHAIQIILICGNRDKLMNRVNAIIAQHAPNDQVSIKTVGYTTDMDEYMTAADILVGKAGGLTVSEALAKGLIMVIIDPLPVWEQRNASHLLEAGAAIRCNNLPALAYKVDQLLDDPARFAMMKENVKRLARPQAAHDIVSKLLTMAA